MAKIVLYTSGTLGDHLPFVALGQALTGRGHQVCLAINKAMHDYARRAGLVSVALTDTEHGQEEARIDAWAWNHWHYPDQTVHPDAPSMDSKEYLSKVHKLGALCSDADLLIATAIRPLGHIVATAYGIPWLTASMNPYAFWQPESDAQRLAQNQQKLKEYRTIRTLIRYVFGKLNKDIVIPSLSPGWLYARHVLLASSPHFALPDSNQLQPQASIDLTGFWFYQDPDWRDWRPDPALEAFCNPSDPADRPIALTFSSQPLEDPGRILNLHVKAAARLGRRLLVQRGWAGFSSDDLTADTDPRSVMFTDFIPHDWLFSRAACTIQHGGIGSMARALCQGCPVLVEPFGNDQLYNADQVVRLGVGLAAHPFETTLEELVRILGKLLDTPHFRRRAQLVGNRIAAEDGLGTACEMIERYLDRLGPTHTPPRIYDRFSPPLTPRKKTDPSPLSPLQSALEAQRPAAATPPGGPLSREIPKIIHQTWKEREVPPDLAAFWATWQEHHPDWIHLLWTDRDNREFLGRHYPWFLPIYDSYPEAIMRADAVRYFILHHHGGLYADLDVESLRPIGPLLTDKQVILGVEPSEHLKTADVRTRGFTRIVGNALMASIPGHPFWEHVFKLLIGFHKAPGPLDATGPYMLTRAVDSFPRKDQISLESAEAVYPIHNEQSWSRLSGQERDMLSQKAYAIHHWHGGWWRPISAMGPHQIRVTLLSQSGAIGASMMLLDPATTSLMREARLPRVSCLMITSSPKRDHLAQLAIELFMKQTYPHKELIIVDDGLEDSLRVWLTENYPDAMDDEQVIYIHLPTENKPLGALRNMAVAKASGDYLAQWDDDDLSHPQRLAVQMAAIHTFRADACTLEREQLWWLHERRLAFSASRLWEGSLICAKTKLPPYPEKRKGEDTPVAEKVVQTGRVALLDYPQLYTYVFHGQNTFDAEHWERHWQAATQLFENDMFGIKIAELQDGLNVDLGPWMEGKSEAVKNEPSLPVTPKESAESPPISGRIRETKVDSLLTQKTISDDPYPRILICIPVKDAEPYLPTLWTNLNVLNYPHQRLSLAFLESDSSDSTLEAIGDRLPILRKTFSRVEVFKRDYGFHSDLPRWEPSQQFRRRSVMAKSRNFLLSSALSDEDWVLWIDADVARWPTDVIGQLLAVKKEIVVPNCLVLGKGHTFDFNTFKFKAGAQDMDWTPYLKDGILQPPKGMGRHYLSDLREYQEVEVDAVGGTMLLVRADLHREGLIFPPFAYKCYIETEGLAFMARDMGYRCWGLPNLEIFHP
jgi:UDP:flavonoid glycosyltransferase YjiC (YdhE family)